MAINKHIAVSPVLDDILVDAEWQLIPVWVDLLTGCVVIEYAYGNDSSIPAATIHPAPAESTANIIVLLCRQVALQTRDLSILRDVVINPLYPCICMCVFIYVCMHACVSGVWIQVGRVIYSRNGYMWRVENLWNRWKRWSVCTYFTCTGYSTQVIIVTPVINIQRYGCIG